MKIPLLHSVRPAAPMTPARARRIAAAKEQLSRGHGPEAQQRAEMERAGVTTLRALFKKKGLL